MKFLTLKTADAAGCLLGHSIRENGKYAFKKGRLLTQEDIKTLCAHGVSRLGVAQLNTGDVHEDVAANRLAQALAGDGVSCTEPAHGRVNLVAEHAGVFLLDLAALERLNAFDPAIALASLPKFSSVRQGQILATCKIIPFAVSGSCLDTALEIVRTPALCVRAFTPKRAALVQTELKGTRIQILDKTKTITHERMLKRSGAIVLDETVSHSVAPLAETIQRCAGLCDMVIIFGASAIVDETDVIPQAIRLAGGHIIRFGMPVDPGNLLVLGRINAVDVIGAPGCARSPALNGFDLVLDRLCADMVVTGSDIAAMGAGGLYKDIITRPQPRALAVSETDKEKARSVTALVLAAGQSQRMGRPNKLLLELEDKPLVRHVVDAALKSNADHVIVVTGHERERLEAALEGAPVTFAHNPRYELGLSTSLAKGVGSLSENVGAVIVLLGDMPLVTPEHINAMLDAYAPEHGSLIIRASHKGQAGNPVLWPRRFFTDLITQTGDKGARLLFKKHATASLFVEIGKAAQQDIDTMDQFESLKT